jgi:hypothetical protein
MTKTNNHNKILQEFLNRLSTSDGLNIIIWEILENKTNGVTIYLARWLLNTGKFIPGDPACDVLSCLANFSGDIEDQNDLIVLTKMARPIVEEIINPNNDTRPIVEEIMECPQ